MFIIIIGRLTHLRQKEHFRQRACSRYHLDHLQWKDPQSLMQPLLRSEGVTQLRCDLSATITVALILIGDKIRYDTRCYFNVRSKADISQLNLPHGTDN